MIWQDGGHGDCERLDMRLSLVQAVAVAVRVTDRDCVVALVHPEYREVLVLNGAFKDPGSRCGTAT